MLLLPGSSSLSKPKLGALLRDIQQKCPLIKSVDVVWVHLVLCKDKKVESELEDTNSPFRIVLDRLLEYGDYDMLLSTPNAIDTGSNVAYVLPRPGSVSPWSSKSTDIGVLCKLGDHIERIERGAVFAFTTTDGSALVEQDIATFSHLIHDRMTQVVKLTPPQESEIFFHDTAKPLRLYSTLNRVEIVGNWMTVDP